MGIWITATLVVVLGAPDGRGAAVRLEGTVAAPAWAVEAVVRDVERYPEWFPSMRSADARSEGVYDTVFQLPWPLRTLSERLAFGHSHVGRAVIIRWHQVSGDFARDEGAWTLSPAGAGRTAVRYDALLQFRRWVPTWLIRRAEVHAAPRILTAIEARARSLLRTAKR